MPCSSTSFIQHKHNDREVVFGKRAITVDGFYIQTQTVYQFHGCFWHGHMCQRTKHEVRPTKNVPTERLESETRNKQYYLQSVGYKVESVWECELSSSVSGNEDMNKF